ncbi:MAG: lytic transglycosylase domain-containing protein [Clostridiales bacterium]|nr:lytic transglycosylase domain-containing protein [Clostridiales bacterium]
MKKRLKYLLAVFTVLMFSVVIVPAFVLCTIYPNKYAAEIGEAADEFGLSRSLVKSVVWAESRFDPHATSHKGAKGLMQLMPETFDMCANALGLRGSNIYDVNTSLRCGCYYLSILIEKFDGNVTAALMAYNAGETNAKRFLDGEKIFPETKKYLSDIDRAQKVYGFFQFGIRD